MIGKERGRMLWRRKESVYQSDSKEMCGASIHDLKNDVGDPHIFIEFKYGNVSEDVPCCGT